MPTDERGRPTTGYGANPQYTDEELLLLQELEKLRLKCQRMTPPRWPTELEKAEVILAFAKQRGFRQLSKEGAKEFDEAMRRREGRKKRQT